MQRIPIGDNPIEAVLTPNSDQLYVSNFNSNSISVIDTATNAVVDTISVNPGADGIVFTSDGTQAYIAHNRSNDVTVIDTATNAVVQVISLTTSGVLGLAAITPDNRFVYVTAVSDDVVRVIDTATNEVVLTIDVGNNPVGTTIPATGNFAYVGNIADDTASIIDLSTNTVVKTLTVGDGPRRVSASPDGSVVLVTNELENTVSIIDTNTNTVVATVPVGTRPFNIAFSPDSSKAYISNFTDNTISVIDLASRTVIDTIGLGTDNDGDGIPDSFERLHGLNPTTAADAALDPDGDGLSNLAEFKAGTEPQNPDTDGDGLSDGDEVNTHHTNPLDADPLVSNDALTLVFGAAHSGPDDISTLYATNPLSGQAAPIGPIGFERISGMDFHPLTGTLYAVGRRPADNTAVLLTIDTTTGQGTEVGPIGLDGVATDLSFRNADNALYAFGFGFLVVTIDPETGAETVLGSAGTSDSGNGIAFSPGSLVDHCQLGIDVPNGTTLLQDEAGNAMVTASFRGDIPRPGHGYGIQLVTVGTDELVNITVNTTIVSSATQSADGTQIIESVPVNLESVERIILRLAFNDTTNRVVPSFSTDDGVTFTEIVLPETATIMTSGDQGFVSVVGSVVVE